MLLERVLSDLIDLADEAKDSGKIILALDILACSRLLERAHEADHRPTAN